MNAKELAQAMAESATQIVEHLLPQGKRAGKEWKAGSTGGESGGSLSVCISGAKRGVWKDFNAGVGGDLLDAVIDSEDVAVAHDPEQQQEQDRRDECELDGARPGFVSQHALR